MNLDAKITDATRCLEREYPNGVEPATLEFVIEEIKREHRRQFRQRMIGHFKSLASVYVKVAQLMHAERLGMRPESMGTQH